MDKTKRRTTKFNDYRELHPYDTYISYNKYRIGSNNQQSRLTEGYMSTGNRFDDCWLSDSRSADCRSSDQKSSNCRSSESDQKSSFCRSSDQKYSSYRSFDSKSSHRMSTDHRSSNCRSSDHRSSDCRSSDCRSSDCRSSYHRSSDHRSSGCRSSYYRYSDRRSYDRRSSDHRTSDYRSSDCRSSGHKLSDSRSSDLRTYDHRSSFCKSSDHWLTNHRSPNRLASQPSDIHISTSHRETDNLSTDYRTIGQNPVNYRSADHRPSYHKCADSKSADDRNAVSRSANSWSWNSRPADQRSADYILDDHKPPHCRSANHDLVQQRQFKQREADHSSKQREADSSSAKHSIDEQRSNMVLHKVAEHSLNDGKLADCLLAAKSSIGNRLTNQRLLECNSTVDSLSDLSSVENSFQSPVEQSIDFPSSDDYAKCILMKVLQFSKPYLKQLLLCIVIDKNKSETLESYAIKKGKDVEWLKKNFTDKQISIIRQNPNCDNFDLTLNFKCIEVFEVFNPTQLKVEKDNISSSNCIKYIKELRNDLCHNRKDLSASQWCDKAKSLKKIIGDLLDIINIWDGEIDTITENIKIEEDIDKVMNENISEKDFRYICLLKVINSISVAFLNNLTHLIFYDKYEPNFKQYFNRKGMSPGNYKYTFYKEERQILESNSEEVQPDLVLYCKMIEAWTTWHPSLKNDVHLREKLIIIIKEIRSLRNHVIHNMLSMNINECNEKAKELGDRLKNFVNFIQNKKLNIPKNVTNINGNKIVTEIEFIMSVPYPY